jgi:prophage antirepressor-like protein
MDIIKAFETNDMQMHITIKGSDEDPLFRASDIGAILDMTNIRASIQDFDNTEKRGVNIIDTIGRNQETTFLTEKGLYKILFKSRKPVAIQFTNWVCEVIKEIRLSGKYALEKQLEDSKNQIKNTIGSKEKNLLTNFSKKPVLYVGYTEKNVVKYGYSDDMETRIKDHKRDIKSDFTFEYVYESLYNREIERQIKKHHIIKSKRIARTYGTKSQTELIQLSETFTIKDLNEIILEIKKQVESDEFETLQKILNSK